MRDSTRAVAASSPQITSWMRSTLVAWLLEVSVQLDLHFDTFMAGVEYLDRYLHASNVTKELLQLSGAVALLLGAKMVEVTSPLTVTAVTRMTDSTRTEVVAEERRMVIALDYALGTTRVPARLPAMRLAITVYVTRSSSLTLGTSCGRKELRVLVDHVSDGRVGVFKRTRSKRRSWVVPFLETLSDERLELYKAASMVG